MMSMKYETDTVYYEWYIADVANLVDRSGRNEAEKEMERERKQWTIVNQKVLFFVCLLFDRSLQNVILGYRLQCVCELIRKWFLWSDTWNMWLEGDKTSDWLSVEDVDSMS